MLAAIRDFFAPRPSPLISPEGVAWIADFEVGGRAYYDRRLRMPTWPGGASGVTIGIGYDLGYNTKAQIAADWAKLVTPQVLAALQSVAGVKGGRAKPLAAELAQDGVRIPWDAALEVFTKSSVPRFAKLMQGAFPGVEALPVPAQEALLSLVFNRGASLKGDSRREMAEIRDFVGYWAGSSNRPRLLGLIADRVEDMKRLWIGKGLDGLLTRRDAEAERIRDAFAIDQRLAEAGGVVRMIPTA